MKPNPFSDEINHGSASSILLLKEELRNEKCPPGTVIIRRTTKEDLINAKQFFSNVIKVTSILSKNDPQDTSAPGSAHHHWATFIAQGEFYGAKGSPTVHGLPGLLPSQVSSAYIIVSNGYHDTFNAAHAGWSVNPSLYGDARSHLNIAWTTDGYHNTGCIDLTCPGFVQVHEHITPGFVFPQLSTYGGQQYGVPLSILKDQQSGNWWLRMGVDKTPIGYWPKSLFNELKNYADNIYWGGVAHAPSQLAGPPMGSGHFAGEGWDKAACFTEMQYMDKNNNFQTPRDVIKLYADSPSCYSVAKASDYDDKDGAAFFFGGPEGCQQ
ncbi:hypothetical protein QJS04_geneDACA012041 [Acorus gramineus]|uniref:Neprosin PEP catalytic domain-containing protein n=1 Tax=Acorus gramineus TaxID=55184 RepID=A0AAV9B913_ACOGR|nr:hypothetical protein QJS04_geneDACA012041 [Acorus gramineus]